MDGWIKLHRKMLHNPIACKDAEYLAVWVYLLLNATHEEYPVMFKGKKIILQPGQLITGRLKIASELSVNESKVKRILNAFKSDQQIDQQSSNKNSLITILNWSEYQKSDQQNDQQMTSQRPTNDQPVTTNKNKRTEEQKKKDKEIKRFAPPTKENVREYCLESGFGVDADRFVDFYEAKGWMVGKNKMKDWKAAVRNWERSDKKETGSVAQKRIIKKPNTFNDNFSQRDRSHEEMLDLERQLLNM